jgi:hypothetical protein
MGQILPDLAPTSRALSMKPPIVDRPSTHTGGSTEQDGAATPPHGDKMQPQGRPRSTPPGRCREDPELHHRRCNRGVHDVRGGLQTVSSRPTDRHRSGPSLPTRTEPPHGVMRATWPHRRGPTAAVFHTGLARWSHPARARRVEARGGAAAGLGFPQATSRDDEGVRGHETVQLTYCTIGGR